MHGSQIAVRDIADSFIYPAMLARWWFQSSIDGMRNPPVMSSAEEHGPQVKHG